MSNQCKNCDRDRDLNNNFVGYPSGYLTTPNNTNNNNSSRNTTSAMTNNSASSVAQSTQIKAKIMFGSVGAIKELREKEHAEKARSTQAGRRQ
ncbi:CLUMA_CG017010, isoform A [Clunio marinus]|uniref:CLUMA_CG017010, isoform A n=1 Tax=Clunio marinus TaxID=568069 RepID=A0A1J1IXI9_9DIPT|nr:CLUMA_CG017010, isoform A [Clunio marinus]